MAIFDKLVKIAKSKVYLTPRSRNITYVPSALLIDTLDRDSVKDKIISKAWSAAKKGIMNRIKDNIVPGALKRYTSKNLDKSFILPGVQKFGVVYAREVTEQYGLQSFTILPWYTKAVVLRIDGKAYTGAFTGIAGDNIFKKFKDELERVDNIITGSSVISSRVLEDENSEQSLSQSLLSTILIGNEGDIDHISLLGFIKSLTVDEDVSSPYIQKYSIDYVGIDRSWYVSEAARKKAIVDSSVSYQSEATNYTDMMSKLPS